jgi:large conductance mechanosensitive channel
MGSDLRVRVARGMSGKFYKWNETETIAGDSLSKNDDDMLEELKKIRALLEPKPAPPAPKGPWAEFMDFISKYKVLGLAVAFIIATYLGLLVLALVKDFIMPLIGLILNPLGLGDLNKAQTTFHTQVFSYGDFLLALITFIIVALIVFLIVKATKNWGME